MRRNWLPILLALAAVSSVDAYVRLTTGPLQTQGPPLIRPDFANIQFLVNTSVAPGATNSDGQTTITPDSDALGAIQAAMNAWNGVSTSAARFAPPQPTSLSNDPADGNHVITIEDTPENRSVAGDLMGVTLFQFTMDGNIVDTDIILNPSIVRDGMEIPYSTNHEMNTVDLQSVLTHELGHALGANHSGLLGAAMFQSSVAAEPGEVAEATLWSSLSPDDIAFVTEAYPAPGADLAFGSITGTVLFADGTPVRGALLTAIDASTGIAVGGISDLLDGSYTIGGIPPGSYLVYAEPMDQPVFPGFLYLPPSAPLDTSFRTAFFGGLDQPATVELVAGSPASAAIMVDSSPPALNLQYVAVDQGLGVIQVADSARVIPGGQACDVLVFGPGLDVNDTVWILGPATIRAGTLRADPTITVNGWVPLRFTVDALTVTAWASASIVVNNGSDASAWSGGLVISPVAASPQ